MSRVRGTAQNSGGEGLPHVRRLTRGEQHAEADQHHALPTLLLPVMAVQLGLHRAAEQLQPLVGVEHLEHVVPLGVDGAQQLLQLEVLLGVVVDAAEEQSDPLQVGAVHGHLVGLEVLEHGLPFL